MLLITLVHVSYNKLFPEIRLIFVTTTFYLRNDAICKAALFSCPAKNINVAYDKQNRNQCSSFLISSNMFTYIRNYIKIPFELY